MDIEQTCWELMEAGVPVELVKPIRDWYKVPLASTRALPGSVPQQILNALSFGPSTQKQIRAQATIPITHAALGMALKRLIEKGEVTEDNGVYSLTNQGAKGDA